jgi:triacylglycerol esterase/lipase EstA (alpha/beta hydrolase family)
MGRRIRVVAALLGVLSSLSVAAVARADLPVVYDFNAGVAAAVAAPGSAPPGADDWSCVPSAAHPRPVVLVHGTAENMRDNFNALSPLLKNNGYCVYALDYGGQHGQSFIGATGPVADSARELAPFVDRVLAATGAAQADVVGHSQGGMMPRYYLKHLGGASKVAHLVGLTPSNHGTTFNGLLTLAAAFPGGSQVVAAGCPACADQTAGSPFLQDLNAGGDTVPGVSYTVITTRYDEVVTPYASAFLSGPDTTNIVVQDQCALDGAEHLAISYDHIALQEVLNALDPASARRAPCTPVLPERGG